MAHSRCEINGTTKGEAQGVVYKKLARFFPVHRMYRAPIPEGSFKSALALLLGSVCLFVFCSAEIGSRVAEAGSQLILWPLPLKCWEYRHVHPRLFSLLNHDPHEERSTD